MFLTRMFDTTFLSPVDKSAYENGEGVFVNANDRNLIGCLGCLSHSALRNKDVTPYSISRHHRDQFLCGNDVHTDIATRYKAYGRKEALDEVCELLKNSNIECLKIVEELKENSCSYT